MRGLCRDVEGADSSELKALEAEIASLKTKLNQQQQRIPEDETNLLTENVPDFTNPLVEDRPKLVEGESSTAVYVGSTACIAFASKVQGQQLQDAPKTQLHRHYYSHVSLTRLATTRFNLPDQGYASVLVQVVFRFIGADYHFLLKKSFLQQLDDTYRDPSNVDPVWLSRLFTVLALGELYSSAMTNSGQTPGMQFFQQAMSVFQDLYEDPSIPYIEALLLIVPPFMTQTNDSHTTLMRSIARTPRTLTSGWHCGCHSVSDFIARLTTNIYRQWNENGGEEYGGPSIRSRDCVPRNWDIPS